MMENFYNEPGIQPRRALFRLCVLQRGAGPGGRAWKEAGPPPEQVVQQRGVVAAKRIGRGDVTYVANI